MRHIRYKFLAGIIHDFHPSKHLIKTFTDLNGFRIRANLKLVLPVSVLNGCNPFGNPSKRFYKMKNQKYSKE